VLGCHAFRATGTTVYLLNGGLWGMASKWRRMKATTKLYDRHNDPVALDQVQRIVL
jgi:hypothetical protein